MEDYHEPHRVQAKRLRAMVMRYGTQIIHGGNAIVKHSGTVNTPDDEYVDVAVRIHEPTDTAFRAALKAECSGYLSALSDL